MNKVSGNDVCISLVESLGFDPSIYKIDADEVIVSLIRRIASYTCPTSKSKIYRLLIQSISTLVDNDRDILERVDNLLDDLIAYGDLIQSEDVVSLDTDQCANWLYTAPPSFVFWGNGRIMLIGITPDNSEYIHSGLNSTIEYRRHTRWLNESDAVDVRESLKSDGLFELDIETWLGSPKKEEPNKFLNRINENLDKSELSGDLENLRILDSSKPVNYYKGRWKEVKNQSGRFICRWKQYVGADLWGYVELVNGHTKRLLILPFENKDYRGCDEAWRAQAAIDYLNNNPQIYKIRGDMTSSEKVIDFFSPLPFWAKRRLDAVGQPVEGVRCLFSYNLPGDFDNELEFIETMLWLKQTKSDIN